MDARKLDRRVQFRRAIVEDDGLASVEKWHEDQRDNHGYPVWAGKTDVSDAERLRAGEVQATLTARFVVRWSVFTAGLTPKDRLHFEGTTYKIFGIKEIGRREGFEITAGARVDQ